MQIKTRAKIFDVPEGKPVLITWKCKNKSRQGISMGIGWLKRSENPLTVFLVHSTFQTWDQMENEYPCKWEIWKSQILDIRIMRRAAQ